MCRTELTIDGHNDAKLKHLTLLMDYIKTTYASITSHLKWYLKNQKIMYDLLWALFKPNAAIYTTILDMEKPACFRFDFSKEITSLGSTGLICGGSGVNEVDTVPGCRWCCMRATGFESSSQWS